MKMYIVYGWINGNDFDAYKPADYTIELKAKNEEEAEEKGDRLLKKKYDNCEVIIAEEITEKA